MLIGTDKVNYGALKGFAGHPQDLVTYAESIVPVWSRHIPNIIENQRYYLAIHLRNVLTLPYKTRKAMIDVLIKDINLSGVMSGFVSISELLEACNKDALISMLKEQL